MKYKLSIIIFLIFLTNGFSQENYDWNNINKVELYSFEKNKKNKEYTSKYFSEKNLIKCDNQKIIQYLKELKPFKYDILIENQFYILRVYFPESQTDFILFVNQGVMFKFNNGNKYFEIGSEFKKLLEGITK